MSDFASLIAELVFRFIFEGLIPELPGRRGSWGCFVVVLLTLLFVAAIGVWIAVTVYAS